MAKRLIGLILLPVLALMAFFFNSVAPYSAAQEMPVASAQESEPVAMPAIVGAGQKAGQTVGNALEMTAAPWPAAYTPAYESSWNGVVSSQAVAANVELVGQIGGQ